VVLALRDGLIEHADLAVLQGIALHLEWISGRCWCSVEELADAAVLPLGQVEAAAARLLAAQLVAIGQDRDLPRMWFWRVHPLVAAHGRPGRDDQMIWGQWRDAVANGLHAIPRPGDLSGYRPRRLRELAREKAARAAALAAGEPIAPRKRSRKASQKRSQDPVAAAA